MVDTPNDPAPDLTRMARRHTYAPVGTCIYCRRCRLPLTLEHIIAESLGGELKLPEASCADCAGKTGAMEGQNAGKLFRPIRRQLGFPQKDRGAKRRAKTQQEVYRVVLDGVPHDIPSTELPGLLTSFKFSMPDILYGLQPVDAPITGGIAMSMLPDFGERLNALRAKHKASNVEITQQGTAEAVARLLAKTGHAYAVAELGLDAFRPLLVDAILGSDALRLGHFIGSSALEAPVGNDLHEIGIDDTGLGGGKYVVVRVQLFANRGMPVHYVVVGEHL
jgi:hypothetical protein